MDYLVVGTQLPFRCLYQGQKAYTSSPTKKVISYNHIGQGYIEGKGISEVYVDYEVWMRWINTEENRRRKPRHSQPWKKNSRNTPQIKKTLLCREESCWSGRKDKKLQPSCHQEHGNAWPACCRCLQPCWDKDEHIDMIRLSVILSNKKIRYQHYHNFINTLLNRSGTCRVKRYS